jgi:hypothetical protein
MVRDFRMPWTRLNSLKTPSRSLRMRSAFLLETRVLAVATVEIEHFGLKDYMRESLPFFGVAYFS